MRQLVDVVVDEVTQAGAPVFAGELVGVVQSVTRLDGARCRLTLNLDVEIMPYRPTEPFSAKVSPQGVHIKPIRSRDEGRLLRGK